MTAFPVFADRKLNLSKGIQPIAERHDVLDLALRHGQLALTDLVRGPSRYELEAPPIARDEPGGVL